jgi:hypothetical protein
MRIGIVLVLTLLLFSNDLLAQTSDKITVSVTVAEDTPGIFASNFKRGLRSLGDVEVVEAVEYPEFSLSIAVLCRGGTGDGECYNAASYSLAVRFYSMWAKTDVQTALWTAIGTRLSAAEMDSVVDAYWSGTPSLQNPHETWVMSWGRQRYRQAIQEFVAELDARCFERERMMDRWVNALMQSDTATTRVLTDKIWGKDAEWLCP